jgi:hypothetical protein
MLSRALQAHHIYQQRNYCQHEDSLRKDKQRNSHKSIVCAVFPQILGRKGANEL